MSRRGEILGEPQFAFEGIPAEAADGTPMGEIVLGAIEGTLRSIPPKRKAPDVVIEAVRSAVRGAINEAWGKKPICKVMLNVVDSR
jgi:ribonuclease J